MPRAKLPSRGLTAEQRRQRRNAEDSRTQVPYGPSRSQLLDPESYRWYYFLMSSAKVAISIEQGLLRKLDLLVERDVFRSRSEAIQTAVREKISRIERSRLAGECAKLDPVEEQCLADQGLANDLLEWPDY